MDKRLYLPLPQENDLNIRLAKALTAIDRQSIIWKSELIDQIKENFFLAVIVSVLLYEYSTRTLKKKNVYRKG